VPITAIRIHLFLYTKYTRAAFAPAPAAAKAGAPAGAAHFIAQEAISFLFFTSYTDFLAD